MHPELKCSVETDHGSVLESLASRRCLLFFAPLTNRRNTWPLKREQVCIESLFLCVSLVRETKKKHVLCTNFVLSLSIEDDRRAMELSNGSMNFWFVSFCLFPVFFSDFLFFYFPAMNPVRISSSSSAESSSSTAQETQSYGHGVKIVNDSNLFERMYVIVIFFVSNSLSLSL